MKSNNGTRLLGLLTVFVLMGMGLLFTAFTVDEIGRKGMEFVVVGLLAGTGFFSLLMLGPIGRAIAALLEPDKASENLLLDRLADIEDRLIEISGEVHRVNDVESRLEFAERLLAGPSGDQSLGDR